MWIYNATTRAYIGPLVDTVPSGCEVTDIAPPEYRPGHQRAFGFAGEWQELPIPSVTVVEGRKALRRAGLLTQTEAIIAQNPDAQDWFEYAPYWERTHPVVISMGQALGLTPEEIDALFLTV